MQQSTLLEEAIWKVLCNVHTALPGTIRDYDPESTTATIQPGFKRKYKNQEKAITLPLLHDVPVLIPRFGDIVIRPPKANLIGSNVMLLIAERSLDSFMQSGEPSELTSYRKFSLSDAVAICGLTTEANPLKTPGDDESFVIAKGKSYMEITKNGKFKLQSGEVELLKDVIYKLLNFLQTTKVITSNGPAPFDPATTPMLQDIELSLKAFGEIPVTPT